MQRAPKNNTTGIPDQLKTGMEQLSGFNLDHVRVHYNSPKPEALKAHAYAQGSDIHLGPGQSHHLGHELGHVVQQIQGRVRPTTSEDGVAINDSATLEQEATQLGLAAQRYVRSTDQNNSDTCLQGGLGDQLITAEDVVQRLSREQASDVLRRASIEQSAQNIDIALAAHGEPEETRNLNARQEEYQNLFADKNPMAYNRSVGFEYEFATYRVREAKIPIGPLVIAEGRDARPERTTASEGEARPSGVESHTVLGQSAPLSRIFNLPYKLETDAQNELELVTPPLLVANTAGGLNTDDIAKLHNMLKDAASRLQSETENGTRVSDIALEDAGFGNGWNFKPLASNLEKAPRDKHVELDGQIYSQLNISMTGEEIGEFMTKQALSEAWSRPSEAPGSRVGVDLFSNVHHEIVTLLTQELNDQLGEEQDAEDQETREEAGPIIQLIARALANTVGLPSVVMNQRHRGELDGSLHSALKETFGIWVKDSVPVVVSRMDISAETAESLQDVIKSRRADLLRILQTGVLTDQNNAIPKVVTQFGLPESVVNESTDDIIALSNGVQQEASASIDLFQAALNDKLEPFKSPPKFLNETFDGDGTTGHGVRKDTFLNIASPAEQSFHLAEIRGDETIAKFLKRREQR